MWCEVAVKVRHPGACKPFSTCGVADRVSRTSSCLPKRPCSGHSETEGLIVPATVSGSVCDILNRCVATGSEWL